MHFYVYGLATILDVYVFQSNGGKQHDNYYGSLFTSDLLYDEYFNTVSCAYGSLALFDVEVISSLLNTEVARLIYQISSFTVNLTACKLVSVMKISQFSNVISSLGNWSSPSTYADLLFVCQGDISWGVKAFRFQIIVRHFFEYELARILDAEQHQTELTTTSRHDGASYNSKLNILFLLQNVIWSILTIAQCAHVCLVFLNVEGVSSLFNTEVARLAHQFCV